MLPRRVLFSLAGWLVMACAVCTPAKAQDCGRYCRQCSTGGWEGYEYSVAGEHDMACQVTEIGCSECGTRVTSSTGISGRSIAQLLGTREEHEMPAAVAAYGNRLLVDDVRSIVGVRGNTCNPEAIDAVVFLTRSKARSLRKAGARSLRDALLRSSDVRARPTL